MENPGTKTVYANRWMSLREDTVRRADGSTGTYTVVDMPDIALIVPFDGRRLHLVEQYRYPVGGRRWEFPSGTVDEAVDHDAEASARRELREETGLVAATLTRLGRLDVAPSTVSHGCQIFLATDLSEGIPQREPEEQDLRSGWHEVAAVRQMVADGSVTDAKTVAAFALFLLDQGATWSAP